VGPNIRSISKVQIKSITDSIFRYCLLFCTLGLTSSPAALQIPIWVPIILFSCGGLLLSMGAFFYCYHSVRNPDYLRSETFQLKKRSIELLGDKENAYPFLPGIIKIMQPEPLDNSKGKSLNEANEKSLYHNSG
jgi:hypothetical protein